MNESIEELKKQTEESLSTGPSFPSNIMIIKTLTERFEKSEKHHPHPQAVLHLASHAP